MKTIITEKINGLDIVKGFGFASVDPEATKLKAAKVFQSSVEYSKLESLQTDIMNLSKMGSESKKKSELLKEQGKGIDADIAHKEYLTRLDQVKSKQDQIKDILPEIDKARNLAIEQSKVYFEPKAGEFIVSDLQHDSVKTAFSSLKEFESLQLNADFSSTVIPNYSGVKYWKKNALWEELAGPLIGEPLPLGGVLEKDLTDAQRKEIADQFEADRVGKLTRAQKDAELLSATDFAAMQAAQMRSKLEIQGVATALADSQAWYQTEINRLTLKYA